MKYTIEIPTVESIEVIVKTAHLKAQKWILDTVAEKIKEQAHKGENEYDLDLSKCEYKLDLAATNEAQNALREMGYMTTYYPRKEILNVDWSPKGQRELKSLQDNNVSWKFATREQISQRQAEIEAILNK